MDRNKDKSGQVIFEVNDGLPVAAYKRMLQPHIRRPSEYVN